MNPNVLIADSEEADRITCARVLKALGFETQVAESGPSALAILENRQVDIVLAAASLSGDKGLNWPKIIKEKYPSIDIVLMTETTATMSAGAYDGYVTKPFQVHEVKHLVERLMQKQELTRENRLLHEQLKTQQGFGSLVGTSSKMQDVYSRILKVAFKRHPVLILGESGTGKELAARAIHA